MGLSIGVIHWAFPPVTGGVEMHLLTICPEMVRRGVQVSVLTGSVAGEPALEEVEGVAVERREGMVPERIGEARDAGEDIYEDSKRMFGAFLDDHRIDVVQAHNLHLDFFDLSRALEDACDERNVPHYLVIHNDVFLDRSEERTKRIVKEISWDKLVAISHFIRDSMRAELPEIRAGRWTVIMHGIDIDTFSPADEARRKELKAAYGFEGRRVTLHPGRFLPWKGILPAIKAMPQIIERVPDALMVLTGRAQRIYEDQDELAMYDATIDQTIQDNDLGKHVHIGTYNHEDIPRLDALSDVVIYTTIGEEPFGLVPVEGMACGVPVVVTDSGGLTESVVDGETGFIISKDEEKLPTELADRVTELLRDEGLAEAFGQQGRERVEQKFDKARMANDFIELSERLFAEGSGRDD
jgi:glycosyltransferase involved in cell wall biosynthesis